MSTKSNEQPAVALTPGNPRASARIPSIVVDPAASPPSVRAQLPTLGRASAPRPGPRPHPEALTKEPSSSSSSSPSSSSSDDEHEHFQQASSTIDITSINVKTLDNPSMDPAIATTKDRLAPTVPGGGLSHRLKFSDHSAVNSARKLPVISSRSPSIAASSQRGRGLFGRRSSSSIGSTNIILFLLGWWPPFVEYVKQQAFLFRASKSGLVWFPTAVALLAGASIITFINLVAHTALPVIGWFNAMHILVLLVAGYVVRIFHWALKEISRYRTSWNLAFNHVVARILFQTVKGLYDSIGKLIVYVLLAFQINSFILMYFAEWEAIHSSLGLKPCGHLQYLKEHLDHVDYSPDYTQGEVSYATIYSYGLPLANGLLAGLGPIPKEAPTNSFEVEGEGPVAVLRVDCDAEPEAYPGTPPINAGTGIELSRSSSNRRSFSINARVILPKVGFHPGFLSINSSWVMQECRVFVLLGRGDWDVEYTVDEWGAVTTGQVLQVRIDDWTVTRRDSGHLFTGGFVNKFNTMYAQGTNPDQNYDFSNDDAEGSSILRALKKVTTQALTSSWYAPSQGGDTSNFMIWGTAANGYYYPNITARGLTAGLGSAFRQVFTQFDGTEDQCMYYAKTGAGMMSLLLPLVTVSDIFIGLAMFLLAFQTVMVHILHRIKNPEALQTAAITTLHEPMRLYYLASFVAVLSKKFKDRRDALLELSGTQLRLGESKSSLESDSAKLAIGPAKETIKMRLNRSYTNHANPIQKADSQNNHDAHSSKSQEI